MINLLIGFYVFCQAFLVCLFLYFIIRKDIEIEKENALMMIIMLAFGPLGVATFLAVMVYERVQEAKRIRCQRAVAKWETKAFNSAGEKSRWNWNSSAGSEEKYNALRENIDCLTDSELELLVKIDIKAYELEKSLKDAVMDEIIHREIMKA